MSFSSRPYCPISQRPATCTERNSVKGFGRLFQPITTLKNSSEQQTDDFTSLCAGATLTLSCPGFLGLSSFFSRKRSYDIFSFLRSLCVYYLTRLWKTTHIISGDPKFTILLFCFIPTSFSLYEIRIIQKKQIRYDSRC